MVQLPRTSHPTVNVLLGRIEDAICRTSVMMPAPGWTETLVGLVPPPLPERGQYDTPYTMGTLGKGTADAGIVTGGVYGGSTDTAETDKTKPHLDEWHRYRKLKNISDVRTQGVKFEPVRIYIVSGSPTYTKYTFVRPLKFDHLGQLVHIGPEQLEETDITSGSGSAGGGVA